MFASVKRLGTISDADLAEMLGALLGPQVKTWEDHDA
jgi:hypothetical protein